MMDNDIRFKQRFQNLMAAYKQLANAIEINKKKPEDLLIQIALIKLFEMSFELSWKTIKDYLNYQGIEVSTPREVIKQAFATKIIEDGQLWIDMLEDRNLMAHTYDQARALKATKHICERYFLGLKHLVSFFQKSAG